MLTPPDRLRLVVRLTVLPPAMWMLLAVPSPAKGQVGGVYIDPGGTLRDAAAIAPGERLNRLRNTAVGEPPARVAEASPLRRVSLARLERAVAARHATDQPLPAEMRYLAGLTAVRYVFFDPGRRDVILAGPAEGWTLAETGEVVGAGSARPVLHLDDLIVALRFAFAGRPESGFIGCSIEPTAEGLRNYAVYVQRLGTIDRNRVNQIFAGMEQAMGPQTIRLFGIEPTSRAAMMMVAADYRLKRLALGHDPSPAREVVNYLDLSTRRFNRRAAQRQHRWWFVGHYDAIHHTADKLAFELDGQGLRVLTARSFPEGPDGNPVDDDDPPSPAAVEFAEAFTRHFSAIAKEWPVFLELQNLVGLATAAELMVRRAEPNTRAGRRGPAARFWRPHHFLDEQRCPLEKFSAPQTVPSLANYRLVQGRHWLISISGGVQIQPGALAAGGVQQETTERELDELHSRMRAEADAEADADDEEWWWD